MMGVVVSMINWKGGVGKTTLTLHLGTGLRHFANKKVLIVDLDPQCNLSFLAIGVENYVKKVYEQELTTLKTVFDLFFGEKEVVAADVIHDKLVKHSPGYVYNDVDLILSHQELVLLDLQLARNRKAGKDHREDTKFELEKLSILHRLLQQVKDKYDYILLDCPPNVNLVTQNAFYASDYYVVPAIPDFLSTTGISLIKKFMSNFNKNFKGMHEYVELEEKYVKTKFGGIIFNMVDEYGGRGVPKKTHAEIIDSIESQHPDKVFDNFITDGDGISVASAENLPVYAYDHFPRSKPNAEKQSDYLEDVVNEFLKKVK